MIKRDSEWKATIKDILLKLKDFNKVYGDEISFRTDDEKIVLTISTDLYNDNFTEMEKCIIGEYVNVVHIDKKTRDNATTEFWNAYNLYDNINELDCDWQLSKETKRAMYEEWTAILEKSPYAKYFKISEERLEQIERELYD